MANMPRDHATYLRQDQIGRLAEAFGALVRAHDLDWFAGLFGEMVRSHDLAWSSHGGKPVTQHGEVERSIERWLRDG